MKKIILLLVLLVPLLTGCAKCIQSHQETRIQPAYTSFVMSGKVMIPIFHPSYEYQADLCDKWEEE